MVSYGICVFFRHKKKQSKSFKVKRDIRGKNTQLQKQPKESKDENYTIAFHKFIKKNQPLHL